MNSHDKTKNGTPDRFQRSPRDKASAMVDEQKIWKHVSRRFGSNDNSKSTGLCLLRGSTSDKIDCPHLAAANQDLGLSAQALSAPVVDRDVLTDGKKHRP